MVCLNCKEQISDNARLCAHCGAQQPISETPSFAATANETQQQPADAPIQQPQKAPQKTNIFVVLAVVLAAFLFGRFVIAPSMLSESDANQPGSQTQQTGLSNNSNASSYDAIFEGTYIFHLQGFSFMEAKHFAQKQDDGMIFCADYGYTGDTVKKWVETLYIPISGYTDEQKALLESESRATLATEEALSCCSVTYTTVGSYFRVTCTSSDIDKVANRTELYNAQLLQSNAPVSMSRIESDLLSMGFVKK